jgi:tellurite resistance protein
VEAAPVNDACLSALRRHIGALTLGRAKSGEFRMNSLGPCKALIYIMIVVSASDREMKDEELERIGHILDIWPVFEDFPKEELLSVSRECQQLLQQPDGLDRVFAVVRNELPKRLHDTAYALAFEVAAVDLEMRLEELRVLQLLRRNLELDQTTIGAIERAAKARHRMLN